MLPVIESFARVYVNSKEERTPERNELIKKAYKELTGKTARNCGTCLIEALFEILKILKMGVCHYHLKDTKGHTGRLRAFGDFSKNCTNKNLTDELAEWHLARNPACAKFFDVMPGKTPDYGIKIVAPNIEVFPKIEITPEFVDEIFSEKVDEILSEKKKRTRKIKT
jgi:hypothetical protein